MKRRISDLERMKKHKRKWNKILIVFIIFPSTRREEREHNDYSTESRGTTIHRPPLREKQGTG